MLPAFDLGLTPGAEVAAKHATTKPPSSPVQVHCPESATAACFVLSCIACPTP